MNRVKDSLLLWQEICRNKVLEKVPIVLFLNKCDLLKAKLAAGVQFRKYMTSYQGPNESAPVAECESMAFVLRARSGPVAWQMRGFPWSPRCRHPGLVAAVEI
jgi:GTPase SAR1 family protein